ncbi:MAG TPA: PqqD family protein [Gemmatimonadales bacterium]|nr:PqqD family protein [Gemmatimonadales bacterium]
MSDAAARPRAREGVILRPLEDEWVLYDPVAQELHTVNRSAALIWAHCTGDETTEDIVAALAAVYEHQVTPEQLAADVTRALAMFRERGLLA